MGTIVVTGSTGGIGTALRRTLDDAGHDVVDRRDAEVVTDLSTEAGRVQMVAEALDTSGGVVDGVVAAAGVLQGEGATVVAVNRRARLARGAAPASCPTRWRRRRARLELRTCQKAVDVELVETCLAGDELRARQLASDDQDGLATYPASKLALARWVRRRAVAPDWAGAGVRLNAVAPGLVDTPMTEELIDVFLGLGTGFRSPWGAPRSQQRSRGWWPTSWALMPASSAGRWSAWTVEPRRPCVGRSGRPCEAVATAGGSEVVRRVYSDAHVMECSPRVRAGAPSGGSATR